MDFFSELHFCTVFIPEKNFFKTQIRFECAESVEQQMNSCRKHIGGWYIKIASFIIDLNRHMLV